MKHYLTILLASICFAVPTFAEEPFDISSHMETILKGSPVPSLAAAAVVDGQVVSLGAAGIRKKNDKTPVTIDDKYHIGSCTKSMTATLGAMLVESGKLEWETTVSEVFTDIDIHENFREVTFRQLLTNTGGLPGDIDSKLWKDLWRMEGSPREQRTQLVKEILRDPPTYAPWTQQVYSNAGFSVAGAMMEAMVDSSYEELLSQMLFKPLSMDSAGFRAPATNGQVDQPYGHMTKFFITVPIDPEPQGDNPPAIAPAGAVHCSIADFAKYALFHLRVAEDLVISKESMDTLHTPEGNREYAMGWIVTNRRWAGGKALTHAGSNTMFYAVIWLAPKKNFAAVAMSNYGGSEGFKKCDEAIAYLIDKHL